MLSNAYFLAKFILIQPRTSPPKFCRIFALLRLDLLNQMLTERNLDQDLRLRIRNFYHQAREARVSAHYTDLIEEMSD